jgi:hypothetical protein
LKSSDESKRPKKAYAGSEAAETPLDDDLVALCDILKHDDGPIRHNLRATPERLVLEEQSSGLEHDFMKEEARSLAAVLRSYHLSDSGKIALAHRISWAVWEYYDSSWMSKRWTYDEVYFIPLEHHNRIDRGGMDATDPFVKVRFGMEEGEEQDLHSEYMKNRVAHSAPRIHALGVMLAGIFGMRMPIKEPGSTPRQVYNKQFSCFTSRCKELADSRQPKYSWVETEVSSQQLQEVISDAVSACFDDSISRGGTSSSSERQGYLYERVVWPFKHLNHVVNKDANKIACWHPRSMVAAKLSDSQAPPQMGVNMTLGVDTASDTDIPAINDDTFGYQNPAKYP